jgi:hypothetical protein
VRTAVFTAYVARHRARWRRVQLHELTLSAELVTPGRVGAVVAACGSAPHFILCSPPCQTVTLICSQRVGFAGERAPKKGAAKAAVNPLMELQRIISEFGCYPREGLIPRPLPASAALAPLRAAADDQSLPPSLRSGWAAAAEAAEAAQRAAEAWRAEAAAQGEGSGRPRRRVTHS